MGIQIENIRRGMGLVVIRGPMKQKFAQYGGEMIGMVEDRSLCDTLLGVIAVSTPYVLCATFGAKLGSPEREPSQIAPLSMFFISNYVEEGKQSCIMLDTRRYELAVASPELIHAIVGVPKTTEGESKSDPQKDFEAAVRALMADGRG